MKRFLDSFLLVCPRSRRIGGTEEDVAFSFQRVIVGDLLGLKILFWCFIGGVTPVLIPNTEVKPISADDTRKGKVGRRQDKTFNHGIKCMGIVPTRTARPKGPAVLVFAEKDARVAADKKDCSRHKRTHNEVLS